MCVPFPHGAHALLKLSDLRFWLFPFPGMCFVYVLLATPLAQIEKDAANKEETVESR